MKKVVLFRGFIGMCIGISICYIIPVIISQIIHDGNFYPVVPQMATTFGSQQKAVVIQLFLNIGLGIIMGVGSLIWNDNPYDITAKTIKHFLLLSVTLLPVAWICHWMHHSVKYVIIYIVQFVLIYFVIWLIVYIRNIKSIKEVNKRIKEMNS